MRCLWLRDNVYSVPVLRGDERPDLVGVMFELIGDIIVAREVGRHGFSKRAGAAINRVKKLYHVEVARL